ncbi:uncharacterized protein LOC143883447 isoform X1 [Tasmannia lanceolata]|uniref:uncharacterized protein LOC143883447 isoform X1 n=1 Tax=Tasmannia lanceolata TaxID=3420 RepID=UPI0040631167
MQRQSLGSSSSKLQIHGGKDEKFEEEESEEKKAEKLVRSSFRTEKFVHLIPVLTIFCFLVLYLVSYDPSQNDPEYSRGHERFLHPKDPEYSRGHERFFHSKDSDEIGRLIQVEKTGILAIHNHRSLQEVAGVRTRKSLPWNNNNLHRKFGDF